MLPVVMISLALALRQMSMTIVAPFISTYCKSLSGCTPLLAGLAVGAFGLMQAIFQIPFGMLERPVWQQTCSPLRPCSSNCWFHSGLFRKKHLDVNSGSCAARRWCGYRCGLFLGGRACRRPEPYKSYEHPWRFYFCGSRSCFCGRTASAQHYACKLDVSSRCSPINL